MQTDFQLHDFQTGSGLGTKKVLRQTIKLQTDGNYWSLMFNYIKI